MRKNFLQKKKQLNIRGLKQNLTLNKKLMLAELDLNMLGKLKNIYLRKLIDGETI